MTEISLQNTTRRKIQQCQIASFSAIIFKIKATKRKKDLFWSRNHRKLWVSTFEKNNNAIVFSFLAIQNIKRHIHTHLGIFYVDILFSIYFV